MVEAWIGMGTNLGDRREHLRAALEGIRRLGRVTKVSPVYETEPVGFAAQGAFLNAVVAVETELGAKELLGELLRIEAERGRVRAEKNGPRTLDLDLLLYGGQRIEEDGLSVPHPRMHERKFVLAPLCDVAGEMVHPLFQRRMRALLDELGSEGGEVSLSSWD